MHRSNTFSTATLDVPNLIGQSPLRHGFPVILFVLAVIFPLSLGLIPAARAQLFSVAVLSGPNGGALQDLGTLGGSFSFATGLNNRGQVSGYSSLPGDNTTQHAFLSAPNGGPFTILGRSTAAIV
jgi:hypothetical protein